MGNNHNCKKLPPPDDPAVKEETPPNKTHTRKSQVTHTSIQRGVGKGVEVPRVRAPPIEVTVYVQGLPLRRARADGFLKHLPWPGGEAQAVPGLIATRPAACALL